MLKESQLNAIRAHVRAYQGRCHAAWSLLTRLISTMCVLHAQILPKPDPAGEGNRAGLHTLSKERAAKWSDSLQVPISAWLHWQGCGAKLHVKACHV